MSKKDDPLDTLLKRYCNTSKGSKIINVIGAVFNIDYDIIYKNKEICYRVNNEILNEKEYFALYKEQQQIYHKQLMDKYGLIESDMIISEENINKIEQDEKRNVGIFGEDKEDLKLSMVDLSTPKIRPC